MSEQSADESEPSPIFGIRSHKMLWRAPDKSGANALSTGLHRALALGLLCHSGTLL
jgi:hypothetical protein